MATSIRNNIVAQATANHTAAQTRDLSQTLRRVASGKRINTAADDAAGAAVSVHLLTRAHSTRQAVRNINDGLAVAQIADDGNKLVIEKLARMKELATQSASETLSNDERSYLQDEFASIHDSMKQTAVRTTWNDQSIFLGGTMDVQVGIDSDSNNRIKIDLPSHSGLYNGFIGYSVKTRTAAKTAIKRLNDGLDFATKEQAGLGASVVQLQAALSNVTTHQAALTEAASRIQDADYAVETAQMTAGQVRQQAGIAAIAQASNLARPVIDLI